MIQDTESFTQKLKPLLLPGLLTLIWLCTLGPLFFRMPVTNDAVLYDLETRWIDSFILPYKDIVEPNFPGVLFIHKGTRFLFGESNEALKLVDLLLLVGSLGCAATLLFWLDRTLKSSFWAVSLALLFYLSQSEWCHCQRDTWLLLPALLATSLRVRQVKYFLEQDSITAFAFSVCEGLIWGAGIWLKPHLIVIVFVVWSFSLLMTPGQERKLYDSLGLLLGGLIAGGIGLKSLHLLGAQSDFFNSMIEWNPGYLSARFDNWTLARYIGMNFRFSPWSFLHLVAIPLSLYSIWRYLSTQRDEEAMTKAILSAVYLVWILQAHLLQHLFDYVHVPGILLALVVISAHSSECSLLHSPPLLLAFTLVACLMSPLVKPKKLSLIPIALDRDLTASETELISRLPNPKWSDLEKVEQYLREQSVSEKDVLMYNSDLVTLYWNLNLQSPTPYVYMFELQHYFPDRKDLFQDSMLNGPQKFIVTDLVSCGMPVLQAEEVDESGELAPPPGYRRANLKHYPWSEPVVFRAGRYMVHRDTRASP